MRLFGRSSDFIVADVPFTMGDKNIYEVRSVLTNFIEYI